MLPRKKEVTRGEILPNVMTVPAVARTPCYDEHVIRPYGLPQSGCHRSCCVATGYVSGTGLRRTLCPPSRLHGYTRHQSRSLGGPRHGLLPICQRRLAGAPSHPRRRSRLGHWQSRGRGTLCEAAHHQRVGRQGFPATGQRPAEDWRFLDRRHGCAARQCRRIVAAEFRTRRH